MNATLAASYQVDREKQAVQWYDAYRKTLENSGWDPLVRFGQFTTSGSSFTMSVAVVAAVLTSAEPAIAMATINALKSLAE